MAYKLSVADVVHVPVVFTQPDGNKTKKFDFTLTCERKGVDEWTASIKNEEGEFSPEKIKEKMLDLATGWCERQNFVLEEDGTPAKFCRDAFEYMVDQPGVLNIIFKAYGIASAAKAKNS
jgi:hypothetical protein